MEQKSILIRKEKNIAWILLNKPEKSNSLDDKMLDLLQTSFEELSSDEQIHCILFRGVGDRAFSSGADISAIATLSTEGAKEFSEKGHRIFRRIMESPKPTIAVVNGYALGGGCELALACDLRIASDKARFSQPEINLGIIPGWGATQLLPRVIGLARAKEMIMTGKPIDAGEAHSIGLVNKVVPLEKLDEEALRMAETLAIGPQKAISEAKRLLNLSQQTNLKDDSEKEIDGFSALFSTDDFTEGVAAFKEKRKPVFRGR